MSGEREESDEGVEDGGWKEIIFLPHCICRTLAHTWPKCLSGGGGSRMDVRSPRAARSSQLHSRIRDWLMRQLLGVSEAACAAPCHCPVLPARKGIAEWSIELLPWCCYQHYQGTWGGCTSTSAQVKAPGVTALNGTRHDDVRSWIKSFSAAVAA